MPLSSAIDELGQEDLCVVVLGNTEVLRICVGAVKTPTHIRKTPALRGRQSEACELIDFWNGPLRFPRRPVPVAIIWAVRHA